MTDAELCSHCTIADRLTWIATPTSPSSSFAVSVSLQGNIKPVPLLTLSRSALQKAKEQKSASLSYVLLDFNSIYVRNSTDEAYRNLKDKHSQTGFVIFHSDHHNCSNILHWPSSRDPQQPSSTEESELMALHQALRSIHNLIDVVFQLIQKGFPELLYIDNQTLWCNLINSTFTSLSEIVLLCREYIHDGTIASTCLTPGENGRVDTFTKQRPNQKYSFAQSTNNLSTRPKRVFMLQTSPYRQCNFINFNRSHARRYYSISNTSMNFLFFLWRKIFLTSTTSYFFKLVHPQPLRTTSFNFIWNSLTLSQTNLFFPSTTITKSETLFSSIRTNQTPSTFNNQKNGVY